MYLIIEIMDNSSSDDGKKSSSSSLELCSTTTIINSNDAYHDQRITNVEFNSGKKNHEYPMESIEPAKSALPLQGIQSF